MMLMEQEVQPLLLLRWAGACVWGTLGGGALLRVKPCPRCAVLN